MSRSEMKTLAKRQMKGRWGSAILIILLSGIIGGAAGLIGSILGPLEILVVMVVNAPMTLGAAMFYLHVIRGEEAGVGDLFQGFSDFKRSFAADVPQKRLLIPVDTASCDSRNYKILFICYVILCSSGQSGDVGK